MPYYLENIEIPRVDSLSVKNALDVLPFNQFTPTEFEKLCLELIREIGDLEDYYRYGKPGEGQYGVDFLVKEKRSEKFICFQCKNWQSLKKQAVDKDISAFIQAKHWERKVDKYIILTSTTLNEEIQQRWIIKGKKKFKEKVKFEIWDKSRLSDEYRKHPRLVERYFGKEIFEKYFSQTERRVSQYFGDREYKESAYWNDYKGASEQLSGNRLFIIRDSIAIDCFLPTLKDVSTFCRIIIRNPAYAHFSITMNYPEILQYLFDGIGLTLNRNARPSINCYPSSKGNEYYAQLANAGFEITKKEALDLANVLDKYYEYYENELLKIESKWRSICFPVKEGDSECLPLIRISRTLWTRILKFSWKNDAIDTDGEWSIFDTKNNYLSIYTSNAKSEMEKGYHAEIVPLLNDNEVDLAWCRPDESDFNFARHQNIGPRYFWDAVTTHDFLVNKLIPHVVQVNENPSPLWKRLIVKFQETNDREYYHSYKDEVINENLHLVNNKEKLQSMAELLQCHYHSSEEVKELTIKARKELYGVVLNVVENTDVGEMLRYTKEKLGIKKADDKKALVTEIKNKIEAIKESFYSNHDLDMVFRVISVLIREEECKLHDYEIQEIAGKLEKYWERAYKNIVLERQKQRICYSSSNRLYYLP